MPHLITARPLIGAPEWDATPIESDGHLDVLRAAASRDSDVAVFWPRLLPFSDDIYELVKACRVARDAAGAHVAVGLAGSTLAAGLASCKAGQLEAVDYLHGPVAFRPTLAAYLVSHGLEMTAGGFSERLSACIRAASLRPSYVIASDYEPPEWCQPACRFWIQRQGVVTSKGDATP